jgi:long-chain acyl-CoA synthetase
MRRDIPLIYNFWWWLANKIVFNNIREQMGLQRLRLFVSGGAPLSIGTAEFFHSIGLIILEGYGLTETSTLVSANRPQWFKFGTVGQPVKGVEVKIADDGEILVRGPNVLQGYYNKPKETSEVIDTEGWFHTGDIGEFDEDNFLKITDRKKDLIVLANGKKVAPQPIENRMKESPYIAQIILLGDKENTVSALIVPSFEHIKDWAKKCSISISFDDNSKLAQHPEVNSLIRNEIQRLSGDLADFEKIRLFTLTVQDFTVESGELTPTLKVKRHFLIEKYKDVIEAMYRG